MLGAAFGALFALDLNDRLGRLNAWRLGALVWASGTFIQVFASGIYGLLLFSRIWGGLGAGVLTVAVPLYLSEIGKFLSCYVHEIACGCAYVHDVYSPVENTRSRGQLLHGNFAAVSYCRYVYGPLV